MTRPEAFRTVPPFGWRASARALLAVGCSLVAACAAPGGAPAEAPRAVVAPPAPAAAPVPPESGAARASASTPAPTASASATKLGTDVKTRNALFKASPFSELPGWGQDDLGTAWDAFQSSCQALGKREPWRQICAKAARQSRNPAEVRRFFEEEFELFRILNTDASRDGDVTGYYEPLISGSLRAEGAFNVPVYGTPNDLFYLDWKTIPEAQRRSVVQVVKNGLRLAYVSVKQPGSFTLDTRQFELDTRDRVWRLQLSGDRALPYRTRAEIEGPGRLDAPVVAYVDDPLALYAMQVQGSGRIRLRDGTVLRVQYAEQNGHPFRPVRLVSTTPERPRTRGAAARAEEPETFRLEGSQAGADDAPVAGVATRGLKRDDSAPANAPPAGGRSAESDSLVDQLLAGTPRKAAPKPAASAAPAAAPSPAQAARPAARPSIAGAPRAGTVVTDPSYVFFRVATDQTIDRGPVGALGVPLTAGRSIAVDPRVTPLGYPVYISAPSVAGSTLPLQRLVIAQDTGGAIRGAIRADFFWGSGADAGRQALRTRQRGQMWLMLPHTEANNLRGSGLLTRGPAGRSGPSQVDAECLVADDRFCSEPD